MKRHLLPILLVLMAVTQLRAADPPATVNYQGVLRDASDKPRTGTFDMVFRFFDALSAGNEILVDSHTGGGGNAVTVTGGLFNVALGGGTVTDGAGTGSYTSLADVFRDYGSVWLDITVGGETLTPRIKVQASAYALNATNLEGRPASGFVDTSSAGQTKAGALTANLGLTGINDTGSTNYGVYGRGTQAGAYFRDSTESGEAEIGIADFGISARGNFVGGYFYDRNNSGSAYVGYGDYGIYSNGNAAGGYFYDNGGDWAYVASGSEGIEAYGINYGVYANGSTGGQFYTTSGNAVVSIASGTVGVNAYGSTAATFGSNGNSFASAASGDTGIYANGRYPASAGHFQDNYYTGESWLGQGDAGVVGRGTWDGGEFSNPTTGALAMLAPNNSSASNAAAYFWNPNAPVPPTNLGVWTLIGSAYYGQGGSGVMSNGGKNFVQNHPSDPSRVVVYTALEGGEAGTYTRGSGTLENGQARVALDPTFALTTDPDIGLTAVVSPRGAWADLYVASVSTNEIVVASRDPQAAGVRFDYVVNGLRLGFENGATILPKDQFPNATVLPIEAAETALTSLPDDVRASTPIARFVAQRPLSARTQPLDLAKAKALIAGIDAPEQAARALAPPSGKRTISTDAPPPAAAAPRPDTPRPDVARAGAERPVAAVPAPARTEASAAAPPAAASVFTVQVGEAVEPGDVLANDPLRPGEMLRSTLAADPQVVGIVASVEGTAHAGTAPLAPAGSVVLCKVDASLGPIAAGDLLVASTDPGHAMRAGDNPKQGTVVAKALESLESGTGLIKVLAMSR